MDHNNQEEHDDSGVPLGFDDLIMLTTTIGLLVSIIWYIGGNIEWRFIGPPLMTAEESHEHISLFWFMQQLGAIGLGLCIAPLWVWSCRSVINKHYQAVETRKKERIRAILADETEASRAQPLLPSKTPRKSSRRHHLPRHRRAA